VNEIAVKLAQIRGAMREHRLGAVRLRGSDWYAWATAGASNVVLLAAETGVAEVLVTADGAWVLTDVIEAERLAGEGFPQGFTLWSHAWQQPALREEMVREMAGGAIVASDRPSSGEVSLPPQLEQQKLRLCEEEIGRYRALSVESAQAMTEVLQAARPEHTEHELAAACAHALMARGIEPLLVQAGGEERVARFRHLLPTAARLGSRAMLAICARRCGLVASATRFVYFRQPTSQERRWTQDVAHIEAACFRACGAGRPMREIYATLAAAYETAGHAEQIDRHHQGGLAGYRAREIVASPHTDAPVPPRCAMAWNPSLPGAKIEDTVAADAGAIEVLTADPAWPVFEVDGRARPDLLVRP